MNTSPDIVEHDQAQNELQESRAMLSVASRIARIGAWALDISSLSLTWSQEVRAIHEVCASYTPTVKGAIAFYIPQHRGKIRAAMNACMLKGTPFDLELQMLSTSGRRVWVRILGETVKDRTGASIRIQGALQDITERKMAAQEMARINRALKMLSRCNEALIRAENEQTLLDEICRIIVDDGGYRMAWAGYAQHDDSLSVKPMAHAGVEEGYLSEIKVSWNENDITGNGPAGQAIRTGQPSICEDMSCDPALAHWLQSSSQRGYRGIICLPLRDGLESFGILGLHSAEANAAGAEEINLLQELANDLAFGILNLRARSEQRRLQSALMRVATSVSAASGNEFFEQLTLNMIEALDAHGGYVAQILPGNPSRARTVAVVMDGKSLDNYDFAIDSTPCWMLMSSENCMIARNAARQFPRAPLITALNAESFAGQQLITSSGEHLSFLCVVFREALENTGFIESTLRIFAARAASELERQHTDARVREQAALLDTAREAIHVEDLEGCIIYWNKGAERTFGWSAQEALGRKASELLYPKSGSLQEARTALMEAGEWQGELKKRSKDGRDITLDARWTLVRDQSGQPKSVFAMSTDITERKRLEAQFFRAQRLDSIGTLASGLAHDLNNILTPITMCAPMLRYGLAPADVEKILTTIETSATRGAQIIKQVLTFGRGIQCELRPLHIGGIIREIVDIVNETFPKNIGIETTVAENLFQIMGDSTQWHQVLMNLSVNARDAMPHGGLLSIDVRNLNVDAQYASMIDGLAEGPHISLNFKDTGSGIPPEVIENIFDPFFSTKEVGKGTGLGLSTVLGIVKSHGGIINLTSLPGNGTTFEIIVPAKPCQSETPIDSEEDALALGAGETILIADDEENVRNAARTVLELHGYRTLVAADGAEALALYARNSDTINAILTDITMPLMDGAAFICSVLRMQPGLPIVASTGQAENQQINALKKLGLKMILRKPYTADVLIRTMQEAMSTAQQVLPAS